MDATFAVAVAITAGRVLITRTHSVGPYRFALPGPARWACLDRRGTPVAPVIETVSYDISERARRAQALGQWFDGYAEARPVVSAELDWSAFAAARAFVVAVGERAAWRSIERLQEVA